MIIDFRERRRRKRQRNINVKEKHRTAASCACPNRGPNPQPRPVPRLGIKHTTFWYMEWCSNQLSHTGQSHLSKICLRLHFHRRHLRLHFHRRGQWQKENFLKNTGLFGAHRNPSHSASTLSAIYSPRAHSAFLPVQVVCHGIAQEAKREYSEWPGNFSWNQVSPSAVSTAECPPWPTNIRLKTFHKRYELNEQFSYSPDAKGAMGLDENGGCLMDNFLCVSTAVFTFGDKFHPTNLRTQLLK